MLTLQQAQKAQFGCSEMSTRRRGIARLVSELRVLWRVERDELASAVVMVLELRVLEPWAIWVAATVLPRAQRVIMNAADTQGFSAANTCITHGV